MPDEKPANYEPSKTLGDGIFQWTAGEVYKTSLGGSFTTSVGQSTAVSAAVDNKLSIGPANSAKWAWETGISFGKKFEYKNVDEIDFKKGSISILEFSGARCLDLFQASAGLGTIERGKFEGQRAAVKTAMKLLIACDALLAVSSVSMSGFGQGFTALGKKGSGNAPNDSFAITSSVTGAQAFLSIIPAIVLLCTQYLSKKQKDTKPSDWNPNAIIQTSATKGVFIGAAPKQGMLPAQLASFIQQNHEGTNWTVFKTQIGDSPSLIGENVGLLEKQEHIIGYDLLTPVTMSTMNMTDTNLEIQTGNLLLDGKTGVGSRVRSDSTMKALFENIDLTAQQSPIGKVPPNASLVLDGGATPKATLSAGAAAPAISSVEATGTALNLKSGPKTSLALDAEGATLRGAVNVAMLAEASAGIRAMEVTIQGRGSLTLKGPIIRLG